MSNVLNIPKDSSADLEVLSAVFLARLDLRKLSAEQAAGEAHEEWHNNIAWFESRSTARGSFLWYCQQLGLEPAAVRQSIADS